MSAEKPNVRGRYVYFTLRDLAAMAGALADVFPAVRWLKSGRPEYEKTLHTSPLGLGAAVAGIIPDEGWSSQLVEKDGFETFARWPRKIIHISLGRWRWLDGYDDPRRDFDLPFADYGIISIGINAKNSDDLKFVKTVYRALGHCMVRGRKGSMMWYGHDMCLWAQEGGPRRVVDSSRWRPPADYVFPADSPYYRGTESIPRGDDIEPGSYRAGEVTA
jgi:hypothetical protein